MVVIWGTSSTAATLLKGGHTNRKDSWACHSRKEMPPLLSQFFYYSYSAGHTGDN